MSTIIRYFVPEDRDIEDKPNAFIIYKTQDQIRFNDIVENFPLPGDYHFRFKTSYEKRNIWIDFSDDTSKVPVFEGKIILKINRVSWEKKNKQEFEAEQEKQEKQTKKENDNANIDYANFDF